MKKPGLQIRKIMVLLLGILLLVGCSDSPSKDDMAAEEAAYDQEASVEVQGSWDYDPGYGAESPEDTGEDGELSESKGQDNILYDSNDKIIRRVSLSLETKAFDDLIKSIDIQVSELGGYIEQSSLTGRHYNSDNLRYGTIIARVPKESVDGFINNLGGIANITWKEENVENVTLQYVDLESRTEALEIEQERLLALLERAEDIEVIISLESRLTSVRYELQSLKTQTRTMDNQVDFSTVTIDIQEVELMSLGIDSDESIGDRITRGIKETFYNIKEGFTNFIVWFVVNLPYIILWLVIILIVIFIIRRFIKKRKLKENLKYMDYTREPNNNQDTNNTENTDESD